MRNYIILNDVNSNTINGLLIQELPPISKPKMRTQIEEIDGRAGDIVTQLGYAAYTKTISVGLYGDFDIDEVISYFNSSGTVVFSNEPDKYYNYEIIDQIDFNRLVRFRTAKVKMHVQPFKYPTEEEPLVAQYQLVTNTGSDMSLNNTANALFRKLDLKGNTSQDGTPTPSSPIPVNVVSGNNTIEITGRNLINMVETNKAVNNQGVISGNNSIYLGVEDYIDVKPNTTYTIQFEHDYAVEGNIANLYVGEKKKDGTFIGRTSFSQNRTFTTGNETYSIFPYLNRSGWEWTEAGGYLELEYGSQRHEYEPFNGETYPISLGDIELCKIGDYQDYIYKDNGSWYLHKEIGKFVLDGSENWVRSANYTDTSLYYVENPFNSDYIPTEMYLNYFVYDTGSDDTPHARWGGTGSSRILIYSPIRNNLANFKTWLGENKPIVYYVLATPTNTEITDADLIEQLEALKLANSYDGQTNISHQYNGSPFILDVAAVQKGSDILVVNNEGNIYARPTLDIEGTGMVNVYLEGNQMFQVDLSENNEIVIDTDEMEAYDPSTQALMNRQVTGNYDNFKIVAGNNNLKFSGDLTKATVTGYVRWL